MGNENATIDPPVKLDAGATDPVARGVEEDGATTKSRNI